MKSQLPCTHSGAPFAGAVQPLPQVPQLAVSVDVSVHEPLQSVRVPPHTEPQIPLLQTSPLGQVLPHSPQCSAFEAKLTQAPSHSVRPVLQAMPQVPAEHLALPPLAGGGHTVSQSPQCCVSSLVRKQAPSQLE